MKAAFRTTAAFVLVICGGANAAIDTRLIADGLNSPLYATAPLGDGRTFIVERGGAIKVSQNSILSNFLSFDVASGGERGLLGLAFDPGYADPVSPGYRRFFVNYIEPGPDPVNQPLHTVVASYRTSDDPSLALPSSRVEVLRFAQPVGAAFHKGGWLGFKPGDANHLYINSGDGGPSANAQSKGNLLGKVLRIDINQDDFPADLNTNYAIPRDNPFVNDPLARSEIFVWGLRNPWRSSFDRATADLWIGDVGLDTREEVNFVAAASQGGQNFGWSYREGLVAGPGGNAPVGASFTDPVFDYEHKPNASNSVIGGYVVRNGTVELDGQYVFGDWRSGGQVWAMPADGKSFADAIDLTALINAGKAGVLAQIASFGEGASGELFVVDYVSGKVVQVVPEPATVLMLAAGLMLLGSRASHRRRAAAVTRSG